MDDRTLAHREPAREVSPGRSMQVERDAAALHGDALNRILVLDVQIADDQVIDLEGLAEAQLGGYPPGVASQALAGTAAAALESAGVSSVRHNWLEVCAIRRGD